MKGELKYLYKKTMHPIFASSKHKRFLTDDEYMANYETVTMATRAYNKLSEFISKHQEQ